MAESKVTIELDASVVRKAVNAKVMPAVERILDGVDLSSRIATALLEKPGKDRRHSIHSMIYGHVDTRPPIDQYIDNAIGEATKSFVEKTLKAERPKIEAALKKMMANSSNTLAKTMLAALDRALESEWNFELDTKVSAKSRHDYD